MNLLHGHGYFMVVKFVDPYGNSRFPTVFRTHKGIGTLPVQISQLSFNTVPVRVKK